MADLSIFATDTGTQRLPAGHRFFTAGESGEEMYVVLGGEVEISLRGKILETVGPGGVFGEMALIDRQKRSADVVAKTDVRVAVIDRKRFLFLLTRNPYFAIEVMTVMTERLRAFDDKL
ncbi:MAG TPA: cyclic nucleotide-binding domain-containing protein [Alphaproteobacteria bacterium]|nr:cyclic nucleotide-binding domain-containing protein [Alphaproteobacteria bacterium]